MVKRWKPHLFWTSSHSSIPSCARYTAISLASLHTAFVLNTVALKAALFCASKVDHAIPPCLQCLLCSSEAQIPVLVWSAATGQRHPISHLCFNLHSSPEHQVTTSPNLWHCSSILYGSCAPLQKQSCSPLSKFISYESNHS